MTKDEIQKILRNGHFDPDEGDSFEVGLWTAFMIALSGIFVYLELENLELPKILLLVFVVLASLIFVYLYRADRKIATVKTGLSEAENLKLLRRILFVLDWPTKESSNLIEVTDDHFLFKHFVRARIIYTDDIVGYVFQYHPTWRGGRPTFFFGLRRVLRYRFKKMLHSFVG
jgi:hypothetical protein